MHTSHLSIPEVRQDLLLPASRLEPVGVLDVLLPERRVSEFQTILKCRKSPCRLIRSILGRYRNRLLREGGINVPRLRTRYQPAGLSLVRFSFRVEADVWVELRMLSLSMRVSMSQIMVWLIEWEYRRWIAARKRRSVYVIWDRVGTPTENRLTLQHNEALSILHLTALFSASRPSLPLAFRQIKEMQYHDPTSDFAEEKDCLS